jgi:hypothetical protein
MSTNETASDGGDGAGTTPQPATTGTGKAKKKSAADKAAEKAVKALVLPTAAAAATALTPIANTHTAVSHTQRCTATVLAVCALGSTEVSDPPLCTRV